MGEVTYGEAFTVQPFGNSLVVKTLTGDQIRQLLEQQFAGCRGQATNRTLQISGFTTFNAGTNAVGSGQDIDALVAAFTAAKPAGIAVPPLARIVTTP